MAEKIDPKCRLCETNNGRFCIPIDGNKPNTLSDKIFKCLGIEIEKTDSNRRICVECTIDINEVYNRLFPSKEIPDADQLSERVLDESLHSSETTIVKPESMESEVTNIVTLNTVNAASTPNQVQVVKDPLDAKKNVAEIVPKPKKKTSKSRKRSLALNHTIICCSVKKPRVHKQPRLRPIASKPSGQRRSKSPIQSTAAASSPRASTPSFRPSPAIKTIRAEVKSTATTSPYHRSRKRPALRSKLISKTFVSRWLDETEIPSNEDSVNPTSFPIAVHDSSLISKLKKSKKSSRRSSATKGKYHQIESILTHKADDAGNDLYLVHWMNHSASHDTWVPFKNFTKDIQTLIESKKQL